MHARLRTEDRHGVAAGAELAAHEDEAGRGGEDGRAGLGEDIDALVHARDAPG
jgi:hypothetical protein